MKNVENHPDELKRQGAKRSIKNSLVRWLQKLSQVLERAEKRITENFRMPPGGG